MHLRGPIFKMPLIILFEKHVSNGNRYLRQSDCFFSWKIEFNPTYKWNLSAQNYVRRCPLIYISQGNRYLRKSGCFFSFSALCVREIEKVKSEKVTKPKYRNVTHFSKLLRSAPQSSLKLVCEASLRFAIKCMYCFPSSPYYNYNTLLFYN